tara:strand:+ start:538 stop:717 length:180 start_codon:yes stop_codon:yes gene_type:complete
VHTICETHFELQPKYETGHGFFHSGPDSYFVGDNGWEKVEESPEPKVDLILPSSFDDND